MGPRPARQTAAETEPPAGENPARRSLQLTLPLFDTEPAADASAPAPAADEEEGEETPPPPKGQDTQKHPTRDRVLIARIAAAERWARTSDRVAATAPARRGMAAKFEREADPDGVLGPDERARRADLLMRAHMLRLARKSARARRR